MTDIIEGRDGPDLSSDELVEADIVHRHGVREHETHGAQGVSYVTCEAARLEGDLTSVEAEAEFLRGGDARALCCEPDEHLLVGRLGPPPRVTQLPTPPGPTCC